MGGDMSGGGEKLMECTGLEGYTFQNALSRFEIFDMIISISVHVGSKQLKLLERDGLHQ